jgi:hypothetical protein
LENSKADSRIQATATKNELKAHFGLEYGFTIPNAEMPFISKRLKDDRVIGRHGGNGDSITSDEMITDFGHMSTAYAHFRRCGK